MVFVNVFYVVFVVTLKLNREGKHVSLPSLKLSYFFLVRVEELQLFLFSLVRHNILHILSSSSYHSVQDTAVEQAHAARIEEKPSMSNVTCPTMGQHLVLP